MTSMIIFTRIVDDLNIDNSWIQKLNDGDSYVFSALNLSEHLLWDFDLVTYFRYLNFVPRERNEVITQISTRYLLK